MNRAVPCLSEPGWYLKKHLPARLLFNVSHFCCQVCGERGDMPCVLASGGVPNCCDSLTLSTNALQKAQEAEPMIHNLGNQFQGLKNQVNNVFSCFICKAVAIKKANYLKFYQLPFSF